MPHIGCHSQCRRGIDAVAGAAPAAAGSRSPALPGAILAPMNAQLPVRCPAPQLPMPPRRARPHV